MKTPPELDAIAKVVLAYRPKPKSQAAKKRVRKRSAMQKLLVSCSGGRSSAYMAWKILQEWKDTHELAFVFANTGKEREETLRFVQRCDDEWGLGVVWVEAVAHPEYRVASTHKIVNFETASRHGEPFEDVIKVYGIPNMNYLHCTRELKANAIRSYMQSIGWKDYLCAQGIRVDEPKRLVSQKPGVIRPLATVWPTIKPEILDWWKEQPFDLGLKDHQGNCDGCHKKHLPKLVRIAQEAPGTFNWWDDMEQRYGLAGHNLDGTPRTFYRGHRSAQDIVAMSKLMTLPPMPDDEEDAGCSESCEAFA